MPDLQVRAAYSIAELSRVSCIERRRLLRVLQEAGVTFLPCGRTRLVSLFEVERKLPLLWEGIKAAYALMDDIE